MVRNLDMVALRAFAAVAETGGVTRAAGVLNLTQSAVSMQLKRLEVSLDTELLDRSGRGIALTSAGEQLLSYARRMLALNDEVWEKLTAEEYEGEVRLGVPHDIVPRAIPQVLRAFNVEFPRMRVQLVSSFTRALKPQFDVGALDVIMTTEVGLEEGGETLTTVPLVWVGAPDGLAWRQRPLRLAFEDACIFRAYAMASLDRAGIPWEFAIQTDSARTVEAAVGADLAVHAMLEGMVLPSLAPVSHGGALPTLKSFNVNLYRSSAFQGAAADRLVELLRQVYPDVMGSSQRPSRLSAAS